MIGTTIQITGQKMSWVERTGTHFDDTEAWSRITKQLVLRPDVSPEAIDINHCTRYMKGWSRIGIMHRVGNNLELCVMFPQGPRPTSYRGALHGAEFVTLVRVRQDWEWQSW